MEQELEYRLETERKSYAVGERIVVDFVWSNLSSKPLLLEVEHGHVEIVGPDGKRLPYEGWIGHARSREFQELLPGAIRKSSMDIAGMDAGPYQLIQLGRYVLKSRFSSYKYPDAKVGSASDSPSCHWVGELVAPELELEIFSPSKEMFEHFRALARTGDLEAIRFAGLNRDEASIPMLEGAYAGGDWNRRYLIAASLARISTDDAVLALERLARGVTKQDRIVLIDHIGKSKNPIAIPILKAYLSIEDDYGGGMERGGEKFRTLVTRKVAAGALQGFGISVPESVYQIPLDKK